MKLPQVSTRTWMMAAVAAVAAFAVWRLFFASYHVPDGLILANGRIEGDHITVATKIAGRIQELKVREGDSVSAGQVLAVLDDAQISAKVAQAQAAAEALQAQLNAAQTALETLQKQVPLDIQSADAGLAQALAVQRKADKAREQDARDATRMSDLAKNGTVATQRAELAQLAATASASDAAAAAAAIAHARSLVATAHLGPDRVRAQQSQVAAVAQQLEQARAALREAQSVHDDLTIRAPQAGVIVTRIRDVGEVLAAGGPLFDLVDLDRLYLKVYVPETQISKVRLNLPARIYTDAFPDQAYPATVRYIASQAEFTPKEVQTPDERVKLTYAVKLYLDSNPDHKLTPGLPADTLIRWRDSVAWTKPRW